MTHSMGVGVGGRTSVLPTAFTSDQPEGYSCEHGTDGREEKYIGQVLLFNQGRFMQTRH